MSDALSIFAAAKEAPHATGLIAGGEHFSFSRLAELTRERLHALAPADDAVAQPLTATSTLHTVVSLYALLEARIPALLLHPRLTDAELAQQRVAVAAHRIADRGAAVVLFTAGTTGTPQAALLTRAALIASAQGNAANIGWHDDDRWLLAMSIGRIGGLSILTRCLAARKTVVLAGFEAARVPQIIDEHRVTLGSFVPTMLLHVLDANSQWQAPAHLRALLIGGAAAPQRLFKRAAAHRLPIVITYGCTETCSQVVATPYSRRFDAGNCGAGCPLPGAEVRIVDGKIHVRGLMRMTGYLGEPALQASEWFDTGDHGEFDDGGCLHVHGRRVDLIVSGGENIAPLEVERVLEAFPGVAAAGVFGLEDDTWGQTVAAALVPHREDFDERALGQYLDATLSPFKRPRRICFVPELPHTAAGKLDRAALLSFAPLLRTPQVVRAADDVVSAAKAGE